MRTVIPFKRQNAKSRLGEILTEAQREELALKMLLDVVSALEAAGLAGIDILTSSVSSIMNTDFPAGTSVLLSEKNLNEALNEYLERAAAHETEEVFIIMADMPLVTEKQITELTALEADIVISPGSGGGTNALLIRQPARFHVDYYGTSFLDHLRIAKESGLSVDIYDSFLVSTDMDEPDDLIELLIHGHGKAVEYLRSIGLALNTATATLDLSRLKNSSAFYG